MMVSFIFEMLPLLIFLEHPLSPIIRGEYEQIVTMEEKSKEAKFQKINDTIIFSSKKYLLYMGFILDKNGENVVLCSAMVYVGSTWALYYLWGQIGGADSKQVKEHLQITLFHTSQDSSLRSQEH